MTAEVASIVLFASDAPRCAEFYRSAGIALVDERHDDGPTHYAAELGPVHFAIYQATGPTASLEHRRPGEVFVGFYVDSLDRVVAALTALGMEASGTHEQMSWGCRQLFHDPDGRTVEINDRNHCPSVG
ncbi:MAG TPA: VOC family protein [Mycobacteriales bacterium]|nr:VOC family protein [Mycobacteriales bacterium]